MSLLFPDERRFYADFSGIAARLTTAATLLEQALDEPARLADSLASIDRVQHEADSAAHDLQMNVLKLFIPPMDREDIHVLSTRLGLVADFIGGTARRVVSLRATSRRESAVRLANAIVRAVREIEAAVGSLRTGDGVLARCLEIKRIEEEGDAAWEAAVTELFSGSPDAVDAIRWMALFDQLEDTLDACEDVANELETITVKHT